MKRAFAWGVLAAVVIGAIAAGLVFAPKITCTALLMFGSVAVVSTAIVWALDEVLR